MRHWLLAGAAALLLASPGGASWAQPDQPQGGDGGGGGGRGALREACQADIARLCADSGDQGGDQSGGPGGGGRRHIGQCLRAHQDQLSDGCKSAMAARAQRHHDGDAPGGDQPSDGSPSPMN
jgi:hypothetical protein